MATAYDVMLTFGSGGQTVQQEIADASDVAAAYLTFKQWGDDTHFKVRQDCFLTDMKVTATGGDVIRLIFEVNGRDVGVDTFIAGLGAATVGRIPSPIGPFRAGSEIRIKQA